MSQGSAHQPPQRWVLAAESALRWRQFDGEWVLYDLGSGNTSRLDPWPAAVLGLIESGCCSREDLLAELAAEVVTEDAAGLAALTDDALQRLTELGLVQTPAA